MKLKDLLQGVEILDIHADMEMTVTGLTYDSRKVTPGCVFVAITGFATDGNLSMYGLPRIGWHWRRPAQTITITPARL